MDRSSDKSADTAERRNEHELDQSVPEIENIIECVTNLSEENGRSTKRSSAKKKGNIEKGKIHNKCIEKMK